ncbi:hypothetical protein [Actinoplanes sp. GCM10030250]|uniref:hypothetical protein n=1 Tax=Actinoplanes sp. GCM10030250 TaxID=3273376 RepID=UPI00361FA7A0
MPWYRRGVPAGSADPHQTGAGLWPGPAQAAGHINPFVGTAGRRAGPLTAPSGMGRPFAWSKRQRVDVLAPASGQALVTVPRLRRAGQMRVTGSHSVVVGDHNRIEVRYRYRVKQVQVERRDVDAVRRAEQDFRRGRDLGRPVTRAEFNRFRSCLRSRLEWPSQAPPVRRVSRSFRSASGYEIAGCSGVVLGNHNRIRSREDLVVRKCAVRLGCLARRDDRLARDLFDSIRAGRRATERLGRAVTDSMGRAKAPEKANALTGLGAIAVTRGRRAGVQGAGAVAIGRGNVTSGKVEKTETGRVEIDAMGYPERNETPHQEMW